MTGLIFGDCADRAGVFAGDFEFYNCAVRANLHTHSAVFAFFAVNNGFSVLNRNSTELTNLSTGSCNAALTQISNINAAGNAALAGSFNNRQNIFIRFLSFSSFLRIFR